MPTSTSPNSSTILLLGSGYMASEYKKVLNSLNQKFIVIGRKHKSYYNKLNWEESYFSIQHDLGNIKDIIKENNISKAIVAIDIENCLQASEILASLGIKDFLVEKPGALKSTELENFKNNSVEKYKLNVYIAYNRRFFSSVDYLKKLNLNFTAARLELTELGDRVANDNSTEASKNRWFIANTSHVLDCFTYLCGDIQSTSSMTTGHLDWHGGGFKNLVGHGLTKNDVTFSYIGVWNSPGRWSIELCTDEERYILCPMEKILIQKKGSFEPVPLNVEESLDLKYKPGLYLQTENFLKNLNTNLKSLDEQINDIKIYSKIAKYDKNITHVKDTK